MNPKNIIVLVVIGVFLIFVLFEVHWGQDIASGKMSEIPDAAVEARYENCYATRDDEMHLEAFGTIDNPDVQREFISANRAVIAAECRAEFPQEMIAVEHENSSKLIELRPRFW